MSAPRRPTASVRMRWRWASAEVEAGRPDESGRRPTCRCPCWPATRTRRVSSASPLPGCGVGRPRGQGVDLVDGPRPSPPRRPAAAGARRGHADLDADPGQRRVGAVDAQHASEVVDALGGRHRRRGAGYAVPRGSRTPASSPLHGRPDRRGARRGPRRMADHQPPLPRRSHHGPTRHPAAAGRSGHPGTDDGMI